MFKTYCFSILTILINPFYVTESLFHSSRFNRLISKQQTYKFKLLNTLTTENLNNNYINIYSNSTDNNMKKVLSLRINPKVRQHVNPLSEKYMKPLLLSKSWLQPVSDNLNQINDINLSINEISDTTITTSTTTSINPSNAIITEENTGGIFKTPQNPIFIDIGSAKGTWAISMGKTFPEYNFLGLEIRRPCVDLAMNRKQVSNLTNVHFYPSNVNIDLKTILLELQNHKIPIKQISIQFPDPQFKKKHYKRKAVNDDLVKTIAKYTIPSTKIFLQSDLKEITQEMLENFLKFSNFYQTCVGYDINKLSLNPSTVPVKTEREIATENKGQDVYRILLERI